MASETVRERFRMDMSPVCQRPAKLDGLTGDGMRDFSTQSARPGVAATAYLAYTLDDNQVEPVTIAAGARSQSVPGR